jgi:anthranilate synthase component I
MVTPALSEFISMAREGQTTPLRRRIPADLETPVSVYLKLAPLGATCLLESVERGIQVGRYSFIGLAPRLDIALEGGEVVRRADGRETRTPVDPADPLADLRAELDQARSLNIPDLPGPLGAAVGYLGWEMVRYFENLTLPDCREPGLPDYRFLFPSGLVAFDHVKSEIEIAVLPTAGDPESGYEDAVGRLTAVVKALRSPLPAGTAAPGPRSGKVLGDGPAGSRLETPRDEFEASVQQAREHIFAGDAFQIVLSQRLAGQTEASPFSVYRALRILNPSPYLFFLDYGDFQLVGSSPESLVTLHGDTAGVVPIAGTRPRGTDPASDAALEAELLESDKERAEHLMLVDLGRNDLGRVCRPGSVHPDSFQQVERYSHVMHLVSRVSGKLAADKDRWDLLKAVFPAGTVSGAPKIRAMEIIAELEGTGRGAYAGAVGYFAPGGDMDLAIAIRTLVMQDGRWWAQAGAGIVADSDPAAEYEETLHKLGALTRAITIAEKGLDQ